MENQKALEFNGTAGGYFVVFLVTAIASFIPLFGTAYAFNFANNWLIENLKVGGKDVQYKAGYGETLKFLFINFLLIIVTLGIYSFWFVPKSYRYVVDHVSASGTTPAPQVPAAPAPPPASNPTATTPPAGLVQ